MSEVRQFIEELRHAGVQLWTHCGELRYAPPGSLAPHHLATLRERRADVIAFLEGSAPRTKNEEELARIWTEVLGLSNIRLNDNFFELGGDSAAAARVAAEVQRATGRDISADAVFEAPTVSAFCDQLGPVAWWPAAPGNRDAGPDLDASPRFDAERVIDDFIDPSIQLSEPDSAEPRHILLTGSTGFVGGHMLAELLAYPDLLIYCLVRRTKVPALQRVLSSLSRSSRAISDVDNARIRIIAGDLSERLLGVGGEEFRVLANIVDSVVHVGADVSALLPYAQLAETNVRGTGELLKLAFTGRLKDFHFISTVAAAGAAAMDLTSGYAVTKWHGELLVRAAARRGLPTAIYRLPRIMPDSSSGRWNGRDIVQRLLRDITALGAAPDFTHVEDWIAGDVVARRLVELVRRRPTGQQFLIAADRPVELSDFVRAASDTGHGLDIWPMHEWMDRLAERAPAEHALMMEFLFPPAGDEGPAPDGRPEIARNFVRLELPRPTRSALLKYVAGARKAIAELD